MGDDILKNLKDLCDVIESYEGINLTLSQPHFLTISRMALKADTAQAVIDDLVEALEQAEYALDRAVVWIPRIANQHKIGTEAITAAQAALQRAKEFSDGE